MNLEPWIVSAGFVVAFVVGRRLLGGRRLPPDALRKRLQGGAKIVDVRSPAEFAGGAYPGAVNIPLQALGGRLGEIPKDAPIVLYCASGFRSGLAAGILKRAGFADVVNAGGLQHMPR